MSAGTWASRSPVLTLTRSSFTERKLLGRDQIGQHDALDVAPGELSALQQGRGEAASEKAGAAGDEDVHAWPFEREAW